MGGGCDLYSSVMFLWGGRPRPRRTPWSGFACTIVALVVHLLPPVIVIASTTTLRFTGRVMDFTVLALFKVKEYP
jgi:hypothetical protein